MNKIAIIDASSASVEIYKIPKHLQNAQCEEIEEYYEINSDSDYIFGELTITDNTRKIPSELIAELKAELGSSQSDLLDEIINLMK
jgi:hypothetical protein